MGREQIVVHGAAHDALRILGNQVKVARAKRGWTQKHLGAVIHTSERTITLIERGAPTVSVGNVFNAAVAVGVPLFQVEDREVLARMRHRGEEIVALIPKRVVEEKVEDDVSLDF
jgi:transcriptional regulator with XRE-family HTH domain